MLENTINHTVETPSDGDLGGLAIIYDCAFTQGVYQRPPGREGSENTKIIHYDFAFSQGVFQRPPRKNIPRINCAAVQGVYERPPKGTLH
jgi:hypothetical protein